MADVLTHLQTDTAAGTPPDVAQIGWSKMAAAYQLLPIVPVQDIPTKADWDATMAGFSKNLLSAVAVNGKVKAVPYTISIPVIFYNADLFKKAGLDPDKPPTTIDALKTDALAIKSKAGAEGAYFAVVDSGKSDYLTQSVIASNGGREIGSDGMPAFDSPAAVSALGAMQDLTTSGAQPAITATSAVAAFAAGKLGMLVGSTAVSASPLKASTGKFELRTTGFPSFGSKPAAPTYSGAGLAVLAKDKTHQQAAWTFIKFLTSNEGFTIITSKIGYLPLRPALATDPKYLQSFFATNKLLSPALSSSTTSARTSRSPARTPARPSSPCRTTRSSRSCCGAPTRRRRCRRWPPRCVASWARSDSARSDRMSLRLSTAAGERGAGHAPPLVRPRDRARPWLYLAPLIVVLLVWVYGPLVFTGVLSFMSWNLTAPHPSWLGTANYSRLAHEAKFHQAGLNTLTYALEMLPFATVVPMALAIALWKRPGRVSKIYRTLLFLPVVVAPVATAITWQFLLDPLSGLVNVVGGWFGFGPRTGSVTRPARSTSSC